MRYLVKRIRPQNPRNCIAHVMVGTDTVCRMLSTGGITRLQRYIETDRLPDGFTVCHMCKPSQRTRPSARAL